MEVEMVLRTNDWKHPLFHCPTLIFLYQKGKTQKCLLLINILQHSILCTHFRKTHTRLQIWLPWFLWTYSRHISHNHVCHTCPGSTRCCTSCIWHCSACCSIQEDMGLQRNIFFRRIYAILVNSGYFKYPKIQNR